MIKLIKLSFVFYIPSAVLFILDINWSGLIKFFTFHSDYSRVDSSFREPLHLIIHNFSGLFKEFGFGDNSLIPRNSGVFWEPGAFAGTSLWYLFWL